LPSGDDYSRAGISHPGRRLVKRAAAAIPALCGNRSRRPRGGEVESAWLPRPSRQVETATEGDELRVWPAWCRRSRLPLRPGWRARGGRRREVREREGVSQGRLALPSRRTGQPFADESACVSYGARAEPMRFRCPISRSSSIAVRSQARSSVAPSRPTSPMGRSPARCCRVRTWCSPAPALTSCRRRMMSDLQPAGDGWLCRRRRHGPEFGADAAAGCTATTAGRALPLNVAVTGGDGTGISITVSAEVDRTQRHRRVERDEQQLQPDIRSTGRPGRPS
jgi:hypothetical protein